MMQTVSIVVTGRVQGVFYRQSAKEKGIELGLTGTVQNLPDGNVYIRASGAREQLDLFINWCWQGPPRAKVASVEATNCPYQKFESFKIVK
jgi:acylphosphatase